ncbi:alpha/beta hydrolase [Spirilliplanes yamanashiensis]|uniref:Esterase n=1 Tax=Spirilliplanes yamanashiensis TaxID=42233 RepID=A0A8J4DGQ9_9ACTN|nr:alpha/beta hydrolase [Spirilliplanes yamanashiensis]MDP9820161.1 acetyl esterase/lipase [Spirilliplanes yamanashiensis]GIJ01019.1 esterase [Spirilliplanes yamanashiensis]
MTASWQMRGVALFTRLAYRRRFATEAAGRARLALPKGPSAPPRSLRPRCVRRQVDGFDVYAVRPRTAPPSGDPIVYLHGGAYVSEIVRQHWDLAAHLADRSGREVHVALYGLAPHHDGLRALAFVTTLVAELSTAGRRCHLVGDSAGGGLALATAQATAQATPVASLTLIAPWLDLSMTNPEIDALEPHDPWLSRPGLRPMAAAWANGLPLTDPRISPLYGDLRDLPPLHLLVGTRDITLADCRALRDRLPADTRLTYHEQQDAIHAYPLLPVPEAREARAAIVAHLRPS